MDWEDTKVLDKATQPIQLMVKEALCIQMIPIKIAELNVTRVMNYLCCWIATMKKLGAELAHATL